MNLDRIGAYASAICAVHCVLTGAAIGLLSAVGVGFVGSPIVEGAFFGTALLVGTWAVIHGIRKHHSYLPAAVYALGVGLLVLSHVSFAHRHELGEAEHSLGTSLLSAAGGLCLVGFHVLNQRLSRRCSCDHCRSGN